MSTSEDEFEWVGDEDEELDLQPCTETYLEDGMLVVHEHLNPYGWMASSEMVEVRQ